MKSKAATTATATPMPGKPLGMFLRVNYIIEATLCYYPALLGFVDPAQTLVTLCPTLDLVNDQALLALPAMHFIARTMSVFMLIIGSMLLWLAYCPDYLTQRVLFGALICTDVINLAVAWSYFQHHLHNSTVLATLFVSVYLLFLRIQTIRTLVKQK